MCSRESSHTSPAQPSPSIRGFALSCCRNTLRCAGLQPTFNSNTVGFENMWFLITGVCCRCLNTAYKLLIICAVCDPPKCSIPSSRTHRISARLLPRLSGRSPAHDGGRQNKLPRTCVNTICEFTIYGDFWQFFAIYDLRQLESLIVKFGKRDL